MKIPIHPSTFRWPLRHWIKLIFFSEKICNRGWWPWRRKKQCIYKSLLIVRLSLYSIRKYWESEKIVCILCHCPQNCIWNSTQLSFCLTGGNQLIKLSIWKNNSSLALKFMFSFELHQDDGESWLFFLTLQCFVKLRCQPQLKSEGFMCDWEWPINQNQIEKYLRYYFCWFDSKEFKCYWQKKGQCTRNIDDL